MAIVILNICYFLGTFWIIICEISREYQKKFFEELSEEDKLLRNLDNFMDDFEIDDNTISHNLILGTYFAFTTLSTVGFGDLYPKSEFERMFCALILLVGVGIFSVFLGDFTEILEKYKAIQRDHDDFEMLEKFFSTLEHFNNDVPIKDEVKNELSKHFEYKWANDLNQFIDNEEDAKIFEQLPEHVQDRVYKEFLYMHFLAEFSFYGDYFKIPKKAI